MNSMSDRYKDFRVRELWQKPTASDRQVMPRLPVLVDETMFNNLCKYPDVYFSIKKYPTEARMCDPSGLHQFDSVSAFYFDIDGHAKGISTKHLIKAANRLANFLIKELDLHDDELAVWWSGRGFHLAIPAEVIMSAPSSGAEQNFKLFAEWTKRTIKLHQEVQCWNNELNTYESKVFDLLDTSIYHRRALIRVPNTMNSASRFRKNLRKTFMPYDALKRLFKEEDPQEQINKLFLIVSNNPWVDGKRWI